MAVTVLGAKRDQFGVYRVDATMSAQNDAFSFSMPRAQTITMQSTGTIGTAHIAITGSNDGTNFVALPTAVDLTAVGLHRLADTNTGFKYYQVTLTTASPGTAIVFTLIGMESC